MKAALYTLGCKVNQYETQAMTETLSSNGYDIVDHRNEADVYVVNSCTVTAESDRKTRQTVRRFKRCHPESCVVLTGCMPQSYPPESLELIEADIILGNANNSILLNSLEQYFISHNRIVNIREHVKGEKFSNTAISKFNERTRAFVKIQDGCDRFCSYCIIPMARGRVRSRSLEDIKAEVERLAEAGYMEVVLVGINLSSYGKDTGSDICEAINAACSVEGIKRVRLGSLEPDHLTDNIIERLAAEKKLCPQFHISLQSGCDATLKRMNRHYSSDEYRKLCEKLKETFVDCSLTTDVMVGFVQESEEEFRDSLDFVKSIGFSKVHIFPYSRREGTRAADMDGQIPNRIKAQRAKEMAAETEKSRRTFMESLNGKIYDVVFETEPEKNVFEGYTPNYVPVRVKSEEKLNRKDVKVKITSVEDEFCVGEVID